MSLASLLSREEVGRADEGWRVMERALQEAPDNADVCNNAGTLLARMGMDGRTNRQTDRQTDHCAHIYRHVSISSGREQEAVAMYERALGLAPDHVTAMMGLARLFRNRRQHDEAERLLRRCCTLYFDLLTLWVQ